MGTLTVQDVALSGLNPSYAAADVAGDEFANNGNILLHVKNGDASSHTVTVASQNDDPEPGTIQSNVAVAIPAGEERMIGPFPQSGYSDVNGNVQVSYDAVTSVTVAAVSMGRFIER